MKRYKPTYLGKVIPDTSDKIKKFMTNKFDAFTEIYNACKNESENIFDFIDVSTDDSESLSIKITTTDESFDNIKSCLGEDMIVDHNVITKK